MYGTCCLNTALIDEQILTDVRQDNVANFARGIALFEGNDGPSENRAVRLFRNTASGNVNGLIAELKRIEIRLDFLVDIPNGVCSRL